MLNKWRPIFWARVTNHEYWPWYVLFVHLLPQYVYYSLRCRSWVWFTNLNPAIPLSGFFGESKAAILAKITPQYKPKAFFIDNPTAAPALEQTLAAAGIWYPFILKPDEGERGNGVALIGSALELELYLKQTDYPLIAQEYVGLGYEFGVFYSKNPGVTTGEVISLTGKEFLAVLGDGAHTLAELVAATTRGLMQVERLGLEQDMTLVLPAGERRLLEPIGNHVRGTLFFDASNLINEQVNSLFSAIAQDIEGFTFGRFDVRVQSLQGLQTGKGLHILELNGISSDPTHVYDPALSYWQVACYLSKHVHRMFLLSQEQRNNGHSPATLANVRAEVRRHKALLVERAQLIQMAVKTSTPGVPYPQQAEANLSLY